MGADANGNMTVVDTTNGTGSQGALSVSTTALLAASTGGANLANRKSLTVYNNSANIVYWGRTSAVTTATGTPIQPQVMLTFDTGPLSNVYLISTAASDVRITESP